MPPLSVIAPLPIAFQRTKRILFEPFILSKWLRLGFCAFLTGSLPMASLGGGNTGVDSDPNSGQAPIDRLTPWIGEHWEILLTVAAILGLLALLLALLLTWLGSRGRFMLLDGVVRNRGAISAPWHEYRCEGNSLFYFRCFLGLASTVMLVTLIAGVLLLTQEQWRAGMVDFRALLVTIIGTFLLVAWFLLMELISILLMDFVAPVMYLRRLTVLPAGKLVMGHLLHDHPGSLLLYLVARLILNSVLATVSLFIVLLTCCIGLVPYIGSVILLPLTIFQITYPLAFLQQLGPQWRLLPPDRQPPQPTAPAV